MIQAVPVESIRRDAVIHKCNALRLEICLERSNALLVRVVRDGILPVSLLEDILKELQAQGVIVELM